MEIAGMDFEKGSFTFKCIERAPSIKAARTNVAGKSTPENQKPANIRTALVTLVNPTK